MIHCVARWDWTTATGHGIVKPSSGWLPDFGLPITGSCRYQRQDPAYPSRRDSLTPEMIQERCLIDDAACGADDIKNILYTGGCSENDAFG